MPTAPAGLLRQCILTSLLGVGHTAGGLRAVAGVAARQLAPALWLQACRPVMLQAAELYQLYQLYQQPPAPQPAMVPHAPGAHAPHP